MAGAVANLTPWKPGQSGNPEGHSKARRARRSLRDALGDILDAALPDEIAVKLAEEIGTAAPEKIADAVALRLSLFALAGKPEVSLAAIGQIRQLEGHDAPTLLPGAEVPEIPDSEAHQEAIKDALREALG